MSLSKAERIVRSAESFIKKRKGVVAKPSEIRALLRDPKTKITKRGRVYQDRYENE